MYLQTTSFAAKGAGVRLHARMDRSVLEQVGLETERLAAYFAIERLAIGVNDRVLEKTFKKSIPYQYCVTMDRYTKYLSIILYLSLKRKPCNICHIDAERHCWGREGTGRQAIPSLETRYTALFVRFSA